MFGGQTRVEGGGGPLLLKNTPDTRKVDRQATTPPSARCLSARQSHVWATEGRAAGEGGGQGALPGRSWGRPPLPRLCPPSATTGKGEAGDRGGGGVAQYRGRGSSTPRLGRPQGRGGARVGMADNGGPDCAGQRWLKNELGPLGGGSTTKMESAEEARVA